MGTVCCSPSSPSPWATWQPLHSPWQPSLNFSRESSCLALRDSNLLSDLCFCTSFILKKLNGLPKLGLIALDALQSFSISFVCMIKTNFKLIDFSFKLFLDSESLTLGTLLCLNGCSKRVHSTSMIFPGVIEFIFLFSNTPVNILSDLTKFKLCSKHLVFFHFKSSFCLLQSSLKFFLFSFK